ncbi:MAG: glycosyl hydrolase [Terrimicrobiaceae bacterium]
MPGKILVVAALIFAASRLSAEADGRVLLPPPTGKLYHGVYPGGIDGEEDDITLSDVLRYERASGRRVAWVYFSNNWYRSRAFPLATAKWIRAHGAVPYIRLMLRSADHKPEKPERTYSLDAIVAGKFDEDFRVWARSAKAFGTPVLVEYGTEMNGEWFGWNGRYHGGAQKRGFGDPQKADGPERFVAAWRHIVKLMRGEGASNLLWIWHPDVIDTPEVAWNRFENYYPGDDVVDWVGVSCYGYLAPRDGWEPGSFRELMDPAYQRLQKLAPSKPIIVAEFGQTSGNPRLSAGEWAARALDDVLGGRWPRVIGFSWWNERWENDDSPKHDTTMRLQDDAALATVFSKKLSEAGKRIQTTPVTGSAR